MMKPLDVSEVPIKRKRVPLPNGIWVLPKGKRWAFIQLIARLLRAKRVEATQWNGPPPYPKEVLHHDELD